MTNAIEMTEASTLRGPLIDALGVLNRILSTQGVAVSLTINLEAVKRGREPFVLAAELVPVAAALSDDEVIE